MCRTLVFVVTTTLASPVAAAVDLTISGYPLVITGDSLEIDGERIRLHGVDAPEVKQTCRTAAGEEWGCGEAARRHLGELIGPHPVHCLALDRDAYMRWQSVCWVMIDGVKRTNLNSQMVFDGLALRDQGGKRAARSEAVSETDLSTPDYQLEETWAREIQTGLWSGTFTPPADWRREHRIGDDGLPADTPESDL